jgi:hypothetical protein
MKIVLKPAWAAMRFTAAPYDANKILNVATLMRNGARATHGGVDALTKPYDIPRRSPETMDSTRPARVLHHRKGTRAIKEIAHNCDWRWAMEIRRAVLPAQRKLSASRTRRLFFVEGNPTNPLLRCRKDGKTLPGQG